RSINVDVAGSDAKFAGGASDVQSLAVNSGAPYRIDAGELLNIRISGQWSPTCALRNAVFSRPLGDGPATVSALGGLTGREGYLVNYQSGQYTARRNDSVRSEHDFQSTDVSGKMCAGVRAEVGPSTPFGSVRVYAYTEACLNMDSGHSTSRDSSVTDSDGRE